MILWTNPINENSVRLTRSGFEWTKRYCGIKYTEVSLSHDIMSKHLLQLERLLKHPYYVRTSTVRGQGLWLYDEADAVMITLHGGNLGQYLDSLEINAN